MVLLRDCPVVNRKQRKIANRTIGRKMTRTKLAAAQESELEFLELVVIVAEIYRKNIYA